METVEPNATSESIFGWNFIKLLYPELKWEKFKIIIGIRKANWMLMSIITIKP